MKKNMCVCVFRALCLLIVFECLCLRMCLLSCVGSVGELLRFDLCCCDLWCFETHVVDLSVFLNFSKHSTLVEVFSFNDCHLTFLFCHFMFVCHMVVDVCVWCVLMKFCSVLLVRDSCCLVVAGVCCMFVMCLFMLVAWFKTCV